MNIITGDSIIVWKQPDRIISAGLSMIRKDVRMSLQEHGQGDTRVQMLKLSRIQSKYLQELISRSATSTWTTLVITSVRSKMRPSR